VVTHFGKYRQDGHLRRKQRQSSSHNNKGFDIVAGRGAAVLHTTFSLFRAKLILVKKNIPIVY